MQVLGFGKLTHAQIKHAIQEEDVLAQFTQGRSLYSSLPDRQWEPVTQGGGTLISPDLGPNGVNVTFEHTMDASFDEDDSEPFGAGHYGLSRNGIPFSMGVARRDFGHEMLNAGTGARMLRAGYS